ncbi:hypothetical protein [Salaquimonas pukyongi]|uniref:hypothetical protein n=1 Tax=Salaquimonas pukyongi TaxID=2712698 RepID=UPI0012EC9D6E|nr:hypothetical protein [Salaquimonas pukyongi]
MNIHKNARLTPKGREILIERLERGEHPREVARHRAAVFSLPETKNPSMQTALI